MDRLDKVVGFAITVLLAALALTLINGDRAGVGIRAFGPQGNAHSTALIQVTFDTLMDTASVEANMHIDPPLEGRFIWNGAQMAYKPTAVLTPGASYTVTIDSGARSAEGRQLSEAQRWSFTVRMPIIAYLAPAIAPEGDSDESPNIWLVDPATPLKPKQLTRNPQGVQDFRVSPDGTQIVYTRLGPGGSADLYVVDVDSGAERRITNCTAAQARCQYADWSPDGTRLVYERLEGSPDIPESDRDLARVWTVNVRDLSTAPLFADPLMLGALPRWSPDGTQIAMFDGNVGAVAIYDLNTAVRKIAGNQEGVTGAYSFDSSGTRFVYPTLISLGSMFSSAVEMVYLNDIARGIIPLSGRDAQNIEDKLPTWRPGYNQVTVTRRYLDGSGPVNPQVYLIDADTMAITPLVIDAAYVHGAINWDATGRWLVVQRFLSGVALPRPGIWVFDTQSKQLTRVAENGYLPAWIP